MIKRCKVDPAIMTILRDYHAYHGDRNIRYAGEMHRPQGAVLYLMRFEDAQGKKFSSLDMIGHGADGEYATEMWSSERNKENEMIRFAMEDKDNDCE